MPQQELLKKVVSVLTRNDIQYMITGSIVSSLQGEPRSTHDIDFVVAISKRAVRKLSEAFPPPRFYLDEASIVSAIDSRTMFNLIDAEEGDKADFWLLTDTPFDQSRFARKITEKLFGIDVRVSSPEDTILAKLVWTKESGGSEKYFVDALRVYEVQFSSLDMEYLEEWTKTLHIVELWKLLRGEAQIP